MQNLWLVWLAFVPAVIEAWICLLFVKGIMVGRSSQPSGLPTSVLDRFTNLLVAERSGTTRQNHHKKGPPARLLIQITSRDTPKDLVDNSIVHVLQSAQDAGLKEFRVWVVTDTPGYTHPSATTVLVPAGFTAACRYKARALEYAKRERTRLGIVGKEWWIYYLDEENLVSAQAFTAIMRYIKEQGDKRPVAVGAITYLRSGSTIAHLCDSIRLLGYIEAHFFMRHFGYFYLQGENTLVRSDIEQCVGWQFGDALAEDLLNGIEIRRKTRAQFGWHGGVIKSLSPETVADLIKQRRRWYCGGMQGVTMRHIPLWQRLHLSYRLGIWTLGFFTIGLSVLGWLYFVLPPHRLLALEIPLWALALLVPTSLLFPVVYFSGALANGHNTFKSVLVALFVPVLAVVETSSAVYSLLRPATGFDIIQKKPRVTPSDLIGVQGSETKSAAESID